ncbi:MAG: hypothetical protein PF694_02825 [Bacteroidetes bacterium]|jgi:hypothetical protein|nr:hypothetical protein [Bacteroidota bacterium]
MRSILLWILSLVLMAALAIYQRTTGPTYPVNGNVEIAGESYAFKLLRSHDANQDAPFVMEVPEGTKGIFRFKRFKSHDEWSAIELQESEGTLKAAIPVQPPAGKVEYQIAVWDGARYLPLTEDPVIIRFKGAVPDFVLIPHIFFMFFAMVFSIRTGFEVLVKGKNTYFYTTGTMLLFLVGGLILGPIVQKYAFDAYWTGWPWGHDLTDNKTIVAFLFWLIAWLVLRKNKQNRVWPAVATFVMLAIYLIPHSALGSEIDYTKLENQPQTESKK